jgi:hypothetical protein
VCPSCRRLLRIPGPGDESAPPVVVEEKQRESDIPKRERKRRKKKKVSAETPWDKESGQMDKGRLKSLPMGWLLAGGIVILTGAMIGLAVTMQRQPAGMPEGIPGVTEVVVPQLPAVAEPKHWYQKEELEELSRAFIKASTVEEMLPLVRDADRLADDIRRYYTEGKLEPMELTSLRVLQDRTAGEQRAVTLWIESKSYQPHFLNVCETADGLRVDWESWVGHSPMPWQEIMEKKPTEPVLVRSLLSLVEYYNMEFSDDQKWSSFRLSSPDGEHVLYAYVQRGSEEQIRLLRLISENSGGENRVSVTIRYPGGAKSGNQVILDRLVADSWLHIDTKP